MLGRVFLVPVRWQGVFFMLCGGLAMLATSPPLVAAAPGTSKVEHQNETFTEDLLLRPLPDGNIMYHFLMQTTWTLPEGWEQGRGERTRGGQHYQVFPKAIGEMVQMYGVGEFHLSFAHGQWLWQRWGHPPVSAPGGLSLWAWFLPLHGGANRKTTTLDGEEVKEALRKAWLGLSNALSGLFGASISLLESPLRHTHPSSSLRPTSPLLRHLWPESPPSSHLFYGSLPREVSCTENLTPWIKLLPCRDRAGLTQLIRPSTLCGALHTSYSAHLTIECGAGGCGTGGHVVKYVQTITSVTNALLPLLSTSTSKRSALRATPPVGAASFGLSQLLAASAGGKVAGCALADSSAVHVHKPAHWDAADEFAVRIGGDHGGSRERDLGAGDGTLWSVDVTSGGGSAVNASVDLKWALLSSASLAATAGSSYVTAHRVKSGIETDRGSMVLDLWNHHPVAAIQVHLLDTLPWFIRLYLHTLRIVVNGTEMEPASALRGANVQLGSTRSGMTLMEFTLDLPPASMSRVTLDFEKAFLHIDEFPPDANRGFDLPSPRISFAAPPHPAPAAASPARQDPGVACSSLPEALGGGRMAEKETCLQDGLRYACINHPQVYVYQALPSKQVLGVGCILKGAASKLCPEGLTLCVERVHRPLAVSQKLLGLGWAAALRGAGGGGEGEEVVLYGESVLLQFPTPDVSMPYNVITLSCTVLALFFGSVFNMLTRKLRPVHKKKDDTEKKQSPLKRLLARIFGKKEEQAGSAGEASGSRDGEEVGPEELARRREQQEAMMREVLERANVRAQQ